MPECRTPGFLVISLPWLLPVLVILLFFCFPLLCSDFLPRSRSLPLSAAAALCQPLPDKCSQNESLISRPGVTEQVNSLGNKVGWLNTPRSRINQWLHSPPWAPAQVFAKYSERGRLFFFFFFWFTMLVCSCCDQLISQLMWPVYENCNAVMPCLCAESGNGSEGSGKAKGTAIQWPQRHRRELPSSKGH